MKFQKGETIVRDDYQFPKGALVVDCQDPDGNIHAHPMGGGFVHTIPATDLPRFRVVPVEEQQARGYHDGTFYLDGLDLEFRGWTRGESWNGWATPHFERSVAEALAAQLSDTQYDAVRNSFVTRQDDGQHPQLDLWEAHNIVTDDGRLVEVYPVGTFAWCWDEQESD